MKIKSKAKWLGEVLGGKWKYDGETTWWCDDEIRSVARVHCGAKDINGEFESGYLPEYWLYGNGTPQSIYWGIVPVTAAKQKGDVV